MQEIVIVALIGLLTGVVVLFVVAPILYYYDRRRRSSDLGTRLPP